MGSLKMTSLFMKRYLDHGARVVSAFCPTGSSTCPGIHLKVATFNAALKKACIPPHDARNQSASVRNYIWLYVFIAAFILLEYLSTSLSLAFNLFLSPRVRYNHLLFQSNSSY